MRAGGRVWSEDQEDAGGVYASLRERCEFPVLVRLVIHAHAPCTTILLHSSMLSSGAALSLCNSGSYFTCNLSFVHAFVRSLVRRRPTSHPAHRLCCVLLMYSLQSSVVPV